MSNISKYKKIQYNDYTAEYIIDFRAMDIVESKIKDTMQPNPDYIDKYFLNKRQVQKIPSLDDIGEMTLLIVNQEEGADIIIYKDLKKLWIKDLSDHYNIPESTIEEKIGRVSDKLWNGYNQWKSYKLFMYFVTFCVSCGFVKLVIDGIVQNYLMSIFVFIFPFYLYILFAIKKEIKNSNPLLPKNVYKKTY